MAKKIPLYDARMLTVMEYMKAEKGIVQRDFLESIGFDHRNVNKIVSGKMSFKILHYDNCIKKHRVNPAFFFKKEEVMF